MKHIVTNIQRFCMHDGPGVRTTVFLKGCPLNCFWCHNPETKLRQPQLEYHSMKCIGCSACLMCKQNVHTMNGGVHRLNRKNCTACGDCAARCPTNALHLIGTEMNSREIIAEACKDKAFYGKEGGITLSGGEPMLYPEACIELLRIAKENGLHTAVETSGFFSTEYVKPLCEVTDILLWDIKDTDDARHKKNIGASNKLILENLCYADTFGVPIVLRCVLLKGVNLNEAHLQAVGELYSALKNAVRIDLLPCHSLGGAKGDALGIETADLSQYEPSAEDMEYAHSVLRPYLSKG